ncbi:MAG: hypothetical protein CMJ79_15700 [Planctomycetaceae bacterium]|nr:hypothetical protein [Planctomycetaceae bacterium]|tara:strand:+ start:21735 stop:23966 length:2232 start_codon:yes stop_codon:yes gene_type:complete
MNDALGEFKMKSSATRVGLTSLLAVCMLGGTGWVVYSKWIGADSSLTGANQTDSEIAGLIDPDAVISEQDIIPPTSDDFDRLSMATDAQPVSGGEDEFTLSIGEDSVSDASADTGDDEFVVGDAAEPTTSTASDADSFVIGDQAAVDQFVASDPADEFTIADDTAPVAPSFDGQEDTTDFQIGDDSVTPTVTEAETPEATTVDEDQFSVSDIPVDPGTNTLVEDQPPVNLADDVALDAPGQLSLTEEPDLSPLPLPEANVDTGSSFEVGSDVSALPELTAQPGSLQLEGQQTPTLTVEKVAPAEVQVNRSAVFTTRIKNTGKVSAHGIRVTDFVPKGARLESAHPEFVQASDGSIQWALGTLEPGDETTVSMKLVPVAEGEIGSVARVSFEALASVRTVSTRPQISITQTAPEKVLIGQSVLVNVTVSNPGSGDATGIVLEADIPAELSHVAGNELEYPVGTLRPGQQKQVALRLTAEAAGVVFNTLTVRGNGQMEDRSVQQIEVVAPDVQVGLRGPKVRYLDREATYAVDVANPGTASARNVNLVAFLSKGLKFVSTDHFGEYDAREHAVYWKLEELPPNVRDSVKLTAVAVEPGEQKIVLEGTADLDVKDSFNHIVRVESVPELEFSIKDTADPIEVGSDTTYEIRVVNRGTRTATGVQIYAAFPEALRAVQGGGPSDLRIEGQNAVFAPLDRLPPNKEAVFRVKAKALGIGDNVIKVQMLSDDVNVPVTKEESTRIYSDN